MTHTNVHPSFPTRERRPSLDDHAQPSNQPAALLWLKLLNVHQHNLRFVQSEGGLNVSTRVREPVVTLVKHVVHEG